MTHAQELAKYGYVVGGASVTGTLSLGYGRTIEYGSVETNKHYVQRFRTIYYTSTAAAGIGFNGFVIVNKGNNKTTFSDFAGNIYGGSVNYGEVSGTYGTSTTYNSWGGGPGFGLSFKIFGSGSVGYTTLLGNPTFSPPINIKDWQPQPYEVGL
jgi:hypothetical protein